MGDDTNWGENRFTDLQEIFSKQIPENKIWIAPIGYRCDAIKYPDCMKGEPFIGDRWNGKSGFFCCIGKTQIAIIMKKIIVHFYTAKLVNIFSQ